MKLFTANGKSPVTVTSAEELKQHTGETHSGYLFAGIRGTIFDRGYTLIVQARADPDRIKRAFPDTRFFAGSEDGQLWRYYFPLDDPINEEHKLRETVSRMFPICPELQTVIRNRFPGYTAFSAVMVEGKKDIREYLETLPKVPLLKTFDADFFNNENIPAPEPIIDRIMYPGLGILGAGPKMGKSYMILQCCCSIVNGSDFLGFPVKRPGPVLYLDLQGTASRTKNRLQAMGRFPAPQGLVVAYEAMPTDEGLIDQLEAWIKAQRGKPVLIVIDMLQQVKGRQRKSEDTYTADNRLLAPLHQFGLEHDLCVMAVMHTRKRNALAPPVDVFEEIIGSTGQFGTADNNWMISGARNQEEKKFSVICRDNDEGQLDFVAHFENHRWSLAGTVQEAEEKAERETFNSSPITYTVRELMKDAPSGWRGTMSDLLEEIVNRTGKYPVTGPEKLGKEVDRMTYNFSLEGIHVERQRMRSGRFYRFFIRSPD